MESRAAEVMRSHDQALAELKRQYEEEVARKRVERTAAVMRAMTPEQRRVFDYHTEKHALENAQGVSMRKYEGGVYACDMVQNPNRPWSPGIDRRSYVIANVYANHRQQLNDLLRKHGFTTEPHDEFRSIR